MSSPLPDDRINRETVANESYFLRVKPSIYILYILPPHFNSLRDRLETIFV